MLNSFLLELKRRRVVRVALVYGAVAFAIVQAADVFVPALALPGWILTAAALLVVLGFPVALVLAWAYDIHPEGSPPGAAADPASAGADPQHLHSGGETPPLRKRSEPAWLSARTLVAVVVLVIVGVVIGAGWLMPPGAPLEARRGVGEAPPPSPWVTRTQLSIDGSSLRGPPALSADGRQMAWAATDGVHIRSLDGLEARMVPGTQGGIGPFFSPDGRSLGFSVEGRLHTVALDGGQPRTLTDSLIWSDAVWGEDGWIYALTVTGYPAVFRTRPEGLATEPVLALDSTFRFLPSALVDGGRVLLGTHLSRPDPDEEVVGHVAVVDLETRVLTPLLRGRQPRHEPLTDHLVFLNGTTLMAVAFDPARAEVTGDPFVAAADDVGAFGLARDGTLWYVQGPIGGNIPVVLAVSIVTSCPS